MVRSHELRAQSGELLDRARRLRGRSQQLMQHRERVQALVAVVLERRGACVPQPAPPSSGAPSPAVVRPSSDDVRPSRAVGSSTPSSMRANSLRMMP
jgi:hypothetical protein